MCKCAEKEEVQLFHGKILIDADACPVRRLVREQAQKNHIPLIMVADDSHLLEDDYATVITVSQGADAADYKLIELTSPGDLVITQDYGVASMALGKGAADISNEGLIFTADNIDQLLFERYLGRRLRETGRKSPKHRPRSSADDQTFLRSLTSILRQDTNPLERKGLSNDPTTD